MMRKKDLLSDEDFNDAGVAKEINPVDYTSIETYQKLFMIDGIIHEHYEAETEDLLNLMTLLSSAKPEIKFIGIKCLRMLMYKFVNALQGDFYTNKEFMASLVATMLTDPNALI